MCVLDFELLEDFLAVLDHGSILAAAEATGSSQPRLSRKIRELEDSLGVLLINRTSRGVSPTVYGSLFKQHAEELLRNRQHALDEIRSLQSGSHGHARIGLAPAFSGYLPDVVRKLRADKPGITFEIVEGTYDTLVQRTLKGDIEGAFTMLPPGESVELLAVRTLPEEALLVVADPMHALFSADAIHPADLENESWVVMNRPRSIVDGFLQLVMGLGLGQPHVAIETSSLDFLKSIVKGSSLLTLLPQGAVHGDLLEGSLKALALDGLPSVATAFIHRHGIMSPLVNEVVHRIESSLKPL